MIIYSAAISVCGKGHQPERALESLAEMQGQVLEPKVITYSAAIIAQLSPPLLRDTHDAGASGWQAIFHVAPWRLLQRSLPLPRRCSPPSEVSTDTRSRSLSVHGELQPSL